MHLITMTLALDSCALEAHIAAIAAGQKDGLVALYEQTRVAVYGFALSILKNVADAEDVLQETYILIYHAAGRYQAQGKPMAWLCTIARNLCLMRLRERGKTVDLAEENWQALPSESTDISPEDRLLLQNLLQTLDETERQIVMLHALAGFKHREIATFLELPLATVLSKYNRAMKKLKNRLKEAE